MFFTSCFPEVPVHVDGQHAAPHVSIPDESAMLEGTYWTLTKQKTDFTLQSKKGKANPGSMELMLGKIRN